MTRMNEDLPPELDGVASMLTDERAALSDAEDVRVRRRVRAAMPSRRPTPMRTRLAIVAMFVLGALTSGTGGALALSGTSGSGSAAIVQYESTQPTQEVAGEQIPTTPTTSTEPETLGATTPQGTNAPAAVAAPQAVHAGDRELPFTGLAAVPLLLAGVAMLAAGALLRRRTVRRQAT